MATDVTRLSDDELRSLQNDIEKEVKRRDRQSKEKALRQIQEIANAAGLDLNNLTQGTLRRSSRRIEYRDPDNEANTWPGRGRKPAWLNKKLEQGHKLEEFKV